MSRLWGRVLRACAISLPLALAGCATWQAPAEISDAPLRSHAVTETQRGVRVSATVLSAADIRHMFGTDLDGSHIQPVWIEVENGTSQPLFLLRSGTDPDYYSPLEVAWALHTPFGGGTNARLDEHFDGLALKNPIAAGATRAGILFTNPQHGTKLLNLDLLGNRTLIPFTLFLPVPSEEQKRLVGFQYPYAQTTNYTDLAALRDALEQMPCCATDVDGTSQGDPLNVVVIGELRDIGAAMVRRGYRREFRADDMAQRVFGREPDVVLRKQAQAGAPSNSLRGWLAPISFDGLPVYVAQAGRPIGGRFAARNVTDIILHDDVDEARNLLIQDMVYSGGLEKVGFVTGVGQTPETTPRSAFHGARYHTDGLRAVLFFATRPLSLSDVEFLDWVPYLERRNGDEGSDARTDVQR